MPQNPFLLKQFEITGELPINSLILGKYPFTDIRHYGSSFEQAIFDIGPTQLKTLVISTQVYLKSDTILSANISVFVYRGGRIYLGNYDLTVNGPFQSEGQAFYYTGTGVVDFSNNKFIHAGKALLFPGTDLGQKINRAWASGIHDVLLPQGSFDYSTTIKPPVDGQLYTLEGAGAYVGTQLTYTATDGTGAIEVDGTAVITNRAILKGFHLIGNAQAGHGILLDRCNRLTKVEDVYATGFTKSGYSGLRVQSNDGWGYTNLVELVNVYLAVNDIGLEAYETTIFNVHGGTIEGNNTLNFRIMDCYQVNFYGTTIQGCISPVSGVGNRIYAQGHNSYNISFFGAWIEEPNCGVAVRIEAQSTHDLVGVAFYNSWIASGVDGGFTIYAKAATGKTKILLKGTAVIGPSSGSNRTLFYLDGANVTIRDEQGEHQRYENLSGGSGTYNEVGY